MIILAIETSTMTGSIAIMSETGLIAETTLNVKATHSEGLMIAIEKILNSSKYSLSDVDAFSVSIGPGSFTGLRVGLSTIKGLAYATGKPVVAVPTLDAFASRLSMCSYLVCPMLDARKKEVYTALYRFNDRTMVKIIEDTAISPEALLSHIKEKTVFLGDGAIIYRDLIIEKLGDMALFAPLPMQIPSAATVAEMGIKMLKAGEVSEINSLVPRYIRKSEAELKWEKR
ncbi:MAG: tRNA (adenosine(37)-N6)-threonylcarbamoyltransferase complex dimerization subunit type 1 TsaB [Nitrospirota bacterium]